MEPKDKVRTRYLGATENLRGTSTNRRAISRSITQGRPAGASNARNARTTGTDGRQSNLVVCFPSNQPGGDSSRLTTMGADALPPTFATERAHPEAAAQTQAGTQANFDGLSAFLPSARLPSTQRSGTADHPGRMRHRTPQNLAITTRKRALLGTGDWRGQSVFESSMTLSHDVHRLYQNQTMKNKMNCLERIMANKLK